MDDWKKYGMVEKGLAPATELEAINRQAMKALTEEEVFPFRIVACDTKVDRDFERFDLATLAQLAKLFVGKPVILDHNWSAKGQTARIYAGEVEAGGDGVSRLVLRAYMLRSESTQDIIAALEGGILREVSVGCAVDKAICSVCGTDKARSMCSHSRGAVYEGETCVVILTGARDAYEVSFVAVPCQPGAGVVKKYGGEDNPPPPEQDPGTDPEREKALALLELEYNRF